MIPRAWSAVVAVVLLGAAAAGCSSSATASESNTASGVATMPIVHGLETKNLIVSDFPAIDSGGLYVAENDGFFAKEGLHVKVVPDFVNSQDTVDKIETGQAQISSGDYVTYMNDLVGSKDSNIMIVAEGSVLQPDVLALMVGPESKIRSLKQLEGQKIPISGTNDIATLLIDSVLTGNGVPFSSVRYIPDTQLPAVPALVKKGVFKAGPVPEPFVSIGEETFGDTVLADLDQGATTGFPIVGYSVTRQWAQQNPNTLKAFVTALEEGQEVAGSDRPALEKALQGQPLKVPADTVATISLPSFPIGIDPVRLQRVISDMIEFGFFTGKQFTKAGHFNVKSATYTANLATSNGQSGLLGG